MNATKALFEAGHPRGKLMDKKLAVRTGGVPVQSGAMRYYLSQGLMRLIPMRPNTTPNATPNTGSANR